MIFRSELFSIELYEEKDFNQPVWYMHPKFGYDVDVVAVPITTISELAGHVVLKPINLYDFYNEDAPAFISDDVFVLGYPLDIVEKSELPIWKKGSIATEPMVNIHNLPKLLIDTATRAGMSGSPVIYQRDGFHIKGKQISNDDYFGRLRGFLGIYSGRIGADDNLKAQLGVVWKKEVIMDILTAKVNGDIQFQKL